MKTEIQAAVPYDDVAARMYAKDPQLVADMLNVCLEEGNIDEFLMTLGHIAKAYGGLHEIARKIGLHENSLYKNLSFNDSNTLHTLIDIANAINLRLVFMPKAVHAVGKESS